MNQCNFIFRIVLTLVVLQLIHPCVAQEPEKNTPSSSYMRTKITRERPNEARVEKGNLLLRMEPLGLIDIFDLNITAGAEYGVGRNISVLADIGYIGASVFGGSGLEGQEGGLNPARGFRMRAGSRLYVSKAYSTWYFEALGTYKQVAYTLGPTWIQHGVVNNVPTWEQWQTYTSQKQVTLVQLITGMRDKLIGGTNWHYEIWGGLGFRHRNYFPDLPSGSRPADGNGFSPFSGLSFGRRSTLDIPLGIRLVYQIR